MHRTKLSVAIALLLASRFSGAAEFTVDSTADSIAQDGNVTLREAVTAASSNSPVNADLPAGDADGDTIVFDPTVFTAGQTITLGLGQLGITDDLIIDASMGGASVTVDGNNASRIFDINTAEFVRITGARLINGNAGNAPGDNGGAIRLATGGDLTLTGVTLSGNTATSGGGVEIRGARISISGSTLVGNAAGVNGGGLHVSSQPVVSDPPGSGGSTITISNSTVQDNTAAQEGGGLWNSADGEMTVTSATISGNTALIQNAANDAQGGGGIFNNGGTVTIQHTSITDNVASGVSAGADDGGGGVFNDGRSTDGARIIISGVSTLSDNTALSTSLNGGGGLNIGANNGAEIAASTGVSITGNTAARAGGGLESNNGILNLTGVEISGNSTGVNGGGVHVTGADQTTIAGSTISGNTAGQEGGGLWNSATGSMQVSNSTVSGNTALIGNAANDAQGGGGVFNNGGMIAIADTWIADNMVVGASAGADDGGGGVFNDGRNTMGARISLTGATTLSDNTVLSTSLNGGGGLNIGAIGSGAELSASAGVSITGNTAARAGGGLESNNGILNLTGVEISGNSTGVNGGGVHVTGADQTTISNSTIRANTAGQEGGGLWNSATGSMQVSNSTISGNTALIGNAANDAQGGGGVFNNGGTVGIQDTSISNNVVSGLSAGADDGGGGVFNDGRNTMGARISLTGATTLSDNTVLGTSLNGGGGLNIAALGSGAELNASAGVRITGNRAARAGGGLESNNGILNLTGVEISGNSTGVNGGGVHVTGADQTTISNSTIRANAAGQEGGGLWNSATGSMQVSNSTVSGNTALIANAAADAQGGGGVFNNGGTVTLANSWITENVVSGDSANADDGGGGVFNDGRHTMGARIELTGLTTISDNTVLSTSLNGGGGLNVGVIDSGAEISASGDVWIHRNDAARAGGGLETINGTLNLSGVWIYDNSTGVNGGGVHVTGADLTTISNSTISANTAGQEGGGLWNSATGVMSVFGSIINSNTALAANTLDAQGGGGVFNNGGAVSLHDSQIVNNLVEGDLDSTDGGGGIFNDGRNTDGALVMISNTDLIDNAVVNTGAPGLAGRGGGALVISDNSNTATLSITGGLLSGNIAEQAGGGIEMRALDSDTLGLAFSSLNVSGSVIQGNLTDSNGGGVHLGAGSGRTDATIEESVIAGNSAGNEGGGLWLGRNDTLTIRDSQIDSNTAPDGAGVFLDGDAPGGSVHLERSAVVRNTASGNGGGVDTEAGTLTLLNSTVSNNTATNGGGLNVDAGTALELQFVTVAENTASGSGGGLQASSGAVNSGLFGYNQAAAGPDVSGTLNTVTSSLISETAGLVINTASASLLNVDPLIGTLADNGGLTQTHALLPNSPALGNADQGNCPEVDQRIFARDDGACDIGALEAGANPEVIFADGFEGQ